MLPTQAAFQAFIFLLLLLSAGHAKATPTTYSSTTTGPSIRLPLVEKDNLSFSPSDHDYPRRLEARMERDARRVSSLIRRLSSGTSAYNNEVFVFSGTYAVTIGVGTPPQSQTLFMDTGSDLVWVHCQPCEHCYDQQYPIFDPSKSNSFSPVPCKSSSDYDVSLCERLDKTDRGCDHDQCTYKYGYADGSHTEGILATENLTFGTTTVPTMPIGCGHKGEGFDKSTNGVLGLGGGFLSFVGGKQGGSFSYCLGGSTNGWLEIGPSSFHRNATWIPMVRDNKINPSLYYVELLGILVGGEKVKIPDDAFQINNGKGGVIFDTGTTLTHLPKAAYEPFREMFVAKTAKLTWAPKYPGYDTCFYSDLAVVPNISFLFSGGLTLNLTHTNYLIQVGNAIVCFAFAPLSGTNLAVLGSILQKGIRISINGLGYIGFGPDGC